MPGTRFLGWAGGAETVRNSSRVGNPPERDELRTHGVHSSARSGAGGGRDGLGTSLGRTGPA